MMVTAIKQAMSEESAEHQYLTGSFVTNDLFSCYDNIPYLMKSNLNCIIYVDDIAFTILFCLCAHVGCIFINLIMTLID